MFWVLGIPKVQQNKQKTSRNKGKTATVSSSSYLQELKEKRDSKQAKKVERTKRNLFLGKQ